MRQRSTAVVRVTARAAAVLAVLAMVALAGGNAFAEKAGPVGIQRIFLEGGRIHVGIAASGGGVADPSDFAAIVLTVEPGDGKPPRMWKLAEVDPGRALRNAGGKIAFDTGIPLAKGGAVKALLSLGGWQTSRKEVLTLVATAVPLKTPTPSIAKVELVGMATLKPTATPLTGAMLPLGRKEEGAPSGGVTMMARMQRALPGGRRAVPNALDDSGGLRITPPTEGQTFRPGGRMGFTVLFLNDAASGMLECQLRRLSSTEPLSGLVVGFDPTPARMSFQGTWPLPATGLPPGSDYYIMASHAGGAWGLSDTFSIVPEGEGGIRFLSPRSGLGATPGTRLEMAYQFTRPAAEGDVEFQLFVLDADGRHGRPVASLTRRYRPQAPGMPEPIFQAEWPLPADLPVGRGFILATHPEASGRSENFPIQWEGTGTSFPSDYSVVDVFMHGATELRATIRATGGDIPDWVEVRAAGYPVRREVVRASADTDVAVATIPADYPCGAPFDVTVDPNGRKEEVNEGNNTLRKWISFWGEDGYATCRETSGSPLFIPCDHEPGMGWGSLHVEVHNCSSEAQPIAGLFGEVRQTGPDLDREVPHGVFVAECGIGRTPRAEATIPPGECGLLRVEIEDLRRTDGDLVVDFGRSWPHLTSPYRVPLRFGSIGTTINTDTGAVIRECVYH